MQASGWLYGLLPALKRSTLINATGARHERAYGFLQYHPFLVTFVIGIILAMERSKQDVNSIQSTKIAVGAARQDWRCNVLANATADLWRDWNDLALQAPFLAQSSLLLLFNVVHTGLRFGLAHYAYRMGVAAIPLIKANTKKSAMLRLSLG